MINIEVKFQNINTQFDEFDTILRNIQASIQALESQVGQLARANSECSPSSLLSNTENNPREYLKTITLRSKEQQVEARAWEGLSVKKDSVIVQEDPKPAEPIIKEDENKHNELHPQQQQSMVFEYKPYIPYPARLKQDKEDAQFKKFLNVFKQLHINIPFVEALSQMPKYAKFMKDLLTNKRKLEELETVALSGNCSAVI